MKLKPIFILGCDRSGTTITKRIVSKSLGLKPLGFEPRLLIDGDYKKGLAISLWREFTTDDAINTKKWIMRQFDIDKRRGWKQFFSEDEFTVRLESIIEALMGCDDKVEAINNFVKSTHSYRHFDESSDTTFFVDDTPANSRIVNHLIEIFPDAKIIHCIRDGREVVQSIMAKGWWSNDQRVVLEKWLGIVRNVRAIGKRLSSENYKEIELNTAQKHPELVYGDLIQWINSDYSLNLADFDSKRKKRAQLSDQVEKYYQYIASDLIEAFNW